MEEHVQAQYSKITEHIYLGTNSCCQTHFKDELLEQGIVADISLEAERIDAAQGVEAYLWLPTVDKTAPTQHALRLGSKVMADVVQAGEKVYVHCMNGHGRGPTLVIAYLVTTGMGVDEAHAFVKERRPEIHLEEVQVEALRVFAQSL